MPSVYDPQQGISGFSPGGIQGYNIQQTPSPGGVSLAAGPMFLGSPIESRIQNRMLLNGLNNRGSFMGRMGGPDFKNWLGTDAAQSMRTIFGRKLAPGQSILDAAAVPGVRGSAKGLKDTEALYRRFMGATAKNKKGLIKSLARGGQYGATMLISDTVTPIIRTIQNEARINKLVPRASRYGAQVARANPLINWNARTASYKGEPMEKKSNWGMLGANLATSIIGSSVAGTVGQELADKAKERKREGTIRRNWDRLVNRYPEFNKDDRMERDEVMDIFEGLHAMSPEITDVPVLAAPLLRNALEYGMKGFSAGDMKTLTDIGFKMKAPADPGAKVMPKFDVGTFGGSDV